MRPCSNILLILACLLGLAGRIGAQTGTGLTGKYYDAPDFTTLKTTRTDVTVNFNWGTAIPAGTALTSADSFSVSWSGQIEPAFSELYTFYVTADDGARLWVDDQMIVGRTFYQAPGGMRGQIRLKAGQKTNIRLEYIENSGSASVKLEWESASQARQIIPTARLYPTTEIPNGGSLMREVWTGLPGTSLTTLTSNASYPNKPASRDFITSFECIAQNWEDNFGTRVTGYIRAPASGNYTFAVSGDEVVQLYLSTDATAANKALIASVASATAFRQWDAQPSQQSAPRALVAGQKYYVELLHKEGTGSDHWSVGWKKPGDAAFSVIPGTVLMMPGTDNAQPATANFFDTLATEHPRLGVSRERFLWLKQQYQNPTASAAKSRAQAVINSATGELTAALVIQRAAQDRVERLALAWWLTGDSQYAEAAWNNIENSINNGDWTDPWKGVEDGVVALGYDWLYPYWSQARKDAMVSCMVNKGFNPGWTDSYANNIGVILNSGHLMAMLAVGTTNEAAAEAKMGTAISRLNTKIDKWNSNAGAWYEGTDYGIFTKWGLGQAMPAMETALGSTFGLSKIEGVSAAAREPLFIASNTRQRFTFSDVGTGSEAAIGWANWWARRYNALETFDYSRQAGNSPLNALTLPETTITPAVAGINPDIAYRGPAGSSGGYYQEVVTMRENWTDTKATFVGCMGGTGSYSHDMLQSGTFQLSARGVKWFLDLSSEDYSVPNHNTNTPDPNGRDRWDYYRNRAEGHNTIVINPDAGPDRTWNSSIATLMNFQSAPGGDRSFAVWDLKPTMIATTTRVNRGVQLLGNRHQVLVQDEIVTPSASTAWWFAHFNNSNTTATISADGTSVTLQQGAERLWGKILSGNGTWTVRAAQPLPSSPAPPEANANATYSKLAINLAGVTNTTLAVWFVPLAPGENPPAAAPAITPLSTWNLATANSAPQATGGSVSSDSLTTDVDLWAYVTDDWSYPHSMSFAVGNPQGGTVTLLADGHTARFTQPPGASGNLSFTFTATDEGGLVSNAGTIKVAVAADIYLWSSLTSGSWSDPAKWSGGRVPTSNPATRVEFLTGTTPGPATITATNNLPGTTSLNALVLGGNGSSASVSISGGQLALAANGGILPSIQAASPAGSSWNVGCPISLGANATVSSDASSLVLSGPISGSGGLVFGGAGPLAITGATANTFDGDTIVRGGSLVLAKSSGVDAIPGNLTVGDGNATGVLQIDQSEQISDSAVLSFNSGQDAGDSTLRIAGGKTETVGGLQTLVSGQMPVIEGIGAGTATLVVNSASSFSYDGVIRDGTGGTLALAKQGNGTLTLRNSQGGAAINFSGGTTVGAGTLALTSEPGAADFGRVIENWSGNVDVSGTLVLTNSSGNETFSRVVSGGGTLTKSGAGTVILGAVQPYTGATNVTAGSLIIPASGGFSRATGGSLLISGGATFEYDSPVQSAFGAVIVGNGNGGSVHALLSQTAGTITATALTLNNGYTGFGAGDVNISGGSLAVSGTATLSSQVAGDNIWSTVTVSGSGSFTVGGGLKLTGAPSAGRNAAGRVVQDGGNVTVAGGLNMARTTAANAAPRRGEYNLNGGTLSVNQITQDAGTDTFGTFVFNGGTLKPTAGNATFLQGLTAAQIQAGGALVDANGFDITIAQPLVGAGGGDGGLIKSGAGTLTLTGASTYNGTTGITAGKLVLSGSLAGDVAVSGGTLGFGSTASIAGNLSLGSGGHFEAAVGAVPGQLTVGGGVVLGGTLDIVAPLGLAAGTQFTILNKTSAGSITGTFAGLPGGCAFTAGGTSWIISYTGGTGNDVTLTVADAAAVWRWNNFGTAANSGSAADSADPDSDGESNLLEFATGQNPRAGSRAAAGLAPVGANNEFTYTRSKAALATGVAFTVEWSDSLQAGSWSSAGVTERIASDDGTLQTVKATIPAASGSKRFVRLKIAE